MLLGYNVTSVPREEGTSNVTAVVAIDSVPSRNSCSLYAIILQVMRSCRVTMRTTRTEYEQEAQLDVREAKRLKKD